MGSRASVRDSPALTDYRIWACAPDWLLLSRGRHRAATNAETALNGAPFWSSPKGREQLAAEKRGERNMGHVIAKSFIARVCANKASAAEIQSGPPSTAPTLDRPSEP